MIVTKYTDVNKCFKVGDIVYACAYQYTHEKEAKSLHQQPIRGILTLGKSVEDTKRRTNRGDTKIEYFVPFKK